MLLHAEIAKQREQTQKATTDKAKAQQRIKEIKEELKEAIEAILANFASSSQPREEKQVINLLLITSRFLTIKQWKKWTEESLLNIPAGEEKRSLIISLVNEWEEAIKKKCINTIR